jgi:predicted CoA-binding protein
VYGSLTDIDQKVDIVDVFRPSEEVEEIANQAIKIGAQVLWLQLDIKSDKARDMVMKNKIYYISNKCTKIEFERLFRASD